MSNATETKPYDLAGNIIAYESGELDEDAVIELFQHLIDTRKILHLQGSYQRTAQALIANGTCTL
jgi:aspartate-semialdehyde dehydrogenase